MPTFVGASEAQKRLLALLRQMKQGKRFTITVGSEPVAELVPSSGAASVDARAAVKAMQQFPRIHGVSAEEISAWIKEGRR
jgi:antitoxin (DNA-binding transcriptional repressor) of toxin-antitoxin stability system